jgi:hypothetical protein
MPGTKSLLSHLKINFPGFSFSIISLLYDNKKNTITNKSSVSKKSIIKKQIHIKNPQKIVLDQIYRFMTKQNCNICTGSFALKVYKDLEKIKNII